MERGEGSSAQQGALTLSECFNSATQPGKFIPAVMHGGFKAGRFVFTACCKKKNQHQQLCCRGGKGALLEKTPIFLIRTKIKLETFH